MKKNCCGPPFSFLGHFSVCTVHREIKPSELKNSLEVSGGSRVVLILSRTRGAEYHDIIWCLDAPSRLERKERTIELFFSVSHSLLNYECSTHTKAQIIPLGSRRCKVLWD